MDRRNTKLLMSFINAMLEGDAHFALVIWADDGPQPAFIGTSAGPAHTEAMLTAASQTVHDNPLGIFETVGNA